MMLTFIIFLQKTSSSTRGVSRRGINAVLKSINRTFVFVKLEGKQKGGVHLLKESPTSSELVKTLSEVVQEKKGSRA